MPGRSVICLVMLLWLVPGSAQAVSCSVDPVLTDADSLAMTWSGNSFQINLTNLSASAIQKESQIALAVGGLTQTRQARLELPADDPDRTTDPGPPSGGGFGERLFWCDINGVPKPNDAINGTHLCSNSDCIITNVTFVDGVPSLSIRNAQDCSGTDGAEFPSCNP